MGQGFEAVLKALGGFASVEVEPEDLENTSSSAHGRQVGGDIGAARATYVAQRGNQSAEAEGLGQTCGGWGQPWSVSASPPRAAAAIAPSCRLGQGVVLGFQELLGTITNFNTYLRRMNPCRCCKIQRRSLDS